METDSGWRPLRRPVRSAPVEATPFARLTGMHALAVAGDTLVTMALAGSLFFSISPTDARGRVALSLVLTMAPFAVVAPFLGPAIDRSRRGRRAMVVGSCAGRAVVALVMARVIDQLLLFPAAFTTLVLSKAYAVAKSALVPAAVQSEDELVEANAKLSITGVVAGFAVALPGVILLRFADARFVLWLASAVFAAGAVAGLRVEEAPHDGSDARSWGSDTKIARQNPHTEVEDLGIVAAAVAMALLRAVVGFLTFLVAFGFRRAGAPSWHFGVVLAASMASTLLASAVAPIARRHLREETILGAALVVAAVVAVAMARVHGALWAAVVALAVGLAAGSARHAFDALVQRDAPAHAHGRSFARFEAGFQLVWVVGALLPVLVTTPLRQGYDVIAIATGAAAVAYLLARRKLRGFGVNT